MKIILISLLLSFSAMAGLPPTSSKGNGESAYLTTFKTNYDTIPVTRSGTTLTIGTIPISKGGTGSTTRNFVDLISDEVVGGNKTFSNTILGSISGNAATVTTNANLTGAVTSTGNATSLGSFTSANLSTALSDETGSGAAVFGTSPQFTTGIGIGAASSATAAVNVNPTLSAGNTQYGLLQNTVFGSSTTTAATGIWSRINTANAAFTLVDAIAFDLVNLSRGAASSVTNSTGLMIRDQTQATNNYGIQNQISSGANKWGYYGAGTAQNYFAGNVGIGIATPAANVALQIDSTTKAFMPPRMTTAQKNAITQAKGMVVYDTDLNALYASDGASWALSNSAAPTVQVFTSGTGTYTTPAGVKWIRVKMVGGGAGGAGSGTASGGTGGAGGNTTFGALTAGGAASTAFGASGAGGAPGAATVGMGSGQGIPGSRGGGVQFTSSSGAQLKGGDGGNSYLGGAGISTYASNGFGAGTNTGSGGGGGGTQGVASSLSGAGGSSGAYIDALVTSPAASYSYAIGAGGAGGSAGTSGQAGGAGAAGMITVEEHY